MDKLYWIWFSQIFTLGSARGNEILKIISSPKELFEASDLTRREYSIFTEAELLALKKSDLTKAEKIYESINKLGGFVLCRNDKSFPIRLSEIYAAPFVLYGLGELPDLNTELPIAMIGTRKPSQYGEVAGRLIAAGLAKAGAVVVSGMADGLDGICQNSAIESGGKTVAVLGSGVDVPYPKSNMQLYDKILSGGGAVISEFIPGTPSAGRNFPIRNRIISGISAGVCIVEANFKSGTLITATHALNQNRDVFAVPGSIFSKTSIGTNNLIKQGAKIVCHPNDILEEYIDTSTYNLNIDVKSIIKSTKEQSKQSEKKDIGKEKKAFTEPKKKKLDLKEIIPTNISDIQEKICTELINAAKTPDELSEKLGVEIRKILINLTELEIMGIIRSAEGRKFTLSAFISENI